MPLRDFKCKACELTQERFYHLHEADSLTCEKCEGALEKLPLTAAYGKTSVFPFTSTHVDGSGKPVTVESIGHLRALEKRHGVCFSAFSSNHRDDSPRDLPEFRPGGEEYRGPRVPWMRR